MEAREACDRRATGDLPPAIAGSDFLTRFLPKVPLAKPRFTLGFILPPAIAGFKVCLLRKLRQVG
jgi:hypothetical protein